MLMLFYGNCVKVGEADVVFFFVPASHSYLVKRKLHVMVYIKEVFQWLGKYDS